MGIVASKDGKRIIKDSIRGTDEWRIGRELAEQFIEQGAEELLREGDSL
jgi:porphobilinogen deaminase